METLSSNNVDAVENSRVLARDVRPPFLQSVYAILSDEIYGIFGSVKLILENDYCLVIFKIVLVI